MTFFSRCEPSAFAEPGLRGASPRPARGARRAFGGSGAWSALLGFAEDLGILVRYAAGLDYYDRAALTRRTEP